MKYGMLPAFWMNHIEKEVREKLARVQLGDEVTEADMFRFGLKLKQEVVGDVMRAIAAGLLKIATERGLCIV